MIINDSGTLALFSLRGETAGDIRSYVIGSGPGNTFAVAPGALELNLVEGRQQHFAAVYSLPDGWAGVTAHSWDRPGEVLSRIVTSSRGVQFEGDSGVWTHLPTAFPVTIHQQRHALDRVLLLDAAERTLRVVTYPEDVDAEEFRSAPPMNVISAGKDVVIGSPKGTLYFVEKKRWISRDCYTGSGTSGHALWFTHSLHKDEMWIAGRDWVQVLRRNFWGNWKKHRETTLLPGAEARLDPVRRLVFSPGGDRFALLRRERQDALIVDCERLEILQRQTYTGVPGATVLCPSGELIGLSTAGEWVTSRRWTGAGVRSAELQMASVT